MNAAYWNAVNEGGEGYVKHAPTPRSSNEVEFDLRDAERDLASAKVNAAYKGGEDGTAYKVERLEAKITKLRAELGLPATPVAAVADLSAPAQASGSAATPQQKAAAQTQARMIAGKRRTHADAVRFAKAALSGGDKVNFLAAVKAAFPELY